MILLALIGLLSGCGQASETLNAPFATGRPLSPLPDATGGDRRTLIYLPFGARLSYVPRIRRVLIITIDGLRPDAITRRGRPTGFAPHIYALAGSGAVDWSARTVIPTATLPAHASLLTGYDVSRHGVDTFAYRTLKSRFGHIPETTILDRVREAGFETAFIAGKRKMDFLVRPSSLDRFHIFGEERVDRKVAGLAIKFVAEDFDLMLVHFPDVDQTGHDSGWMSDDYLAAVRRMDRQVGRVLAALDQLGLADTTLVILTADHGGHERGHTTGTPEDQQIPWIIAGPGVVSGQTLSDRDIRIMDTAPTVLWALGIQLPPDLEGRPILEAFNPAPLPARPAPAQR